MTQKRILFLCIALMLALLALSFVDRAQAQAKGAGFNDALIGDLVKTALYNDAALRSMDIRVEVRDRVVHLRGFVDSLSEMARAEALARAVDGVAAVRNALRVANRPSRA